MFAPRVTFPLGKQLSCHLAQAFPSQQQNLTSNTPCLTKTAWSCAPWRTKGTPGTFRLSTEASCDTRKHQHQAKAGVMLLDTIPLCQLLQVLSSEVGKE